MLYIVPFLNCALEAIQRGEIRQRRGIEGGCFGDFMLIFCCSLCTLVQEAQEAQELLTQTATLQGLGQVLPAGTVLVTTTSYAASGGPGAQVYLPSSQYPPPGQQYAPGTQYPPPGQEYAMPGQQYPTPQHEEKGQAMERQ